MTRTSITKNTTGHPRQWIVITGGGSGIGRILVHHFSSSNTKTNPYNYNVLTCGRRLSALEQTKTTAPNPDRVFIAQADIAVAEDRDKFVTVLIEDNTAAVADVVLLIQNAAIGDPSTTYYDINPSYLEYAFRVNVVAPLALVQALRQNLRTNGGGRVLHLGTSIAHRPQKGTLTYGVTKMAFHRLYQQLNMDESKNDADRTIDDKDKDGREHGNGKIVCGSISPGLVDSEGVRDHVEKARSCNLPHVDYFDRALENNDDNNDNNDHDRRRSTMTTQPEELIEFITEYILPMEDTKFISQEWRFSEWRDEKNKHRHQQLEKVC